MEDRESSMRKAFSLVLLTACPWIAYSNCPGPETWSGAVDGSWNNVLNWSPNTCVPGSLNTDTDSATFGDTVGASSTIFLDPIPISPGLNQLIFNNLSTSYTIDSVFQFLQFNGSSSFIEDLAGSHVLNAPVRLNNTTLQITATHLLTLQQPFTEASGSTSSISFQGPGELINLNNIIDVNGNITILNGELNHKNTLTLSGVGNIGSLITTGALLSVSGNLSMVNGGAISTGGNGCFLGALNAVIAGNLTSENNGSITTTAAGNFFSVQNMTVSGILSNVNNGSVSGNVSVGSFVSVLFDLVLNGGSVTNSNTGVVSSQGIGSLIEAQRSIVINSGNFINNDTVWTPLLTIGPAGTLAGTGLFQDINRAPTIKIVNAGLVIPGDTEFGGFPGLIQVDGSFTQQGAGQFGVNILNTTAFSQLGVTGPVQLAGSLQTAIATDGGVIIPGQTFPIILANGGISGTFSSIVNFNIPNLTPHVQYLGNQVLLSFTPSASKYPNYFETLFLANNQMVKRLEREMAQLRGRFGREESGYLVAENEISEIVSVNPQLAFIRLQPTRQKQEQLRQALETSEKYPWNIYLGATGDFGDVLTKKKAVGFHYRSAGVIAGFDYAFSQVGVGLLTNYDRIWADVAHHWGKFDIDHLHANLYATYAPKSVPELAVNAIVGGGYDWVEVKRKVSSEVGKGSPHGAEWNGLLGVEYAFDRSRYSAMPACLQVVPLVSLQYTHLHASKYREHGAGLFDLDFSKQNGESLRSTVGARFNYTWKWTDIVFVPEVNVGWQREFLDKGRKVHFTPAHFSVAKTSLRMGDAGRNAALAGIDFLVMLFDKYGLEASYDFEWNSLYHDHFFYVGANFRF